MKIYISGFLYSSTNYEEGEEGGKEGEEIVNMGR